MENDLIYIIMICQYGASTKIIAERIRQEAEKMKVSIYIKAYSFSEFINYPVDELNITDIILVAPQVCYRIEEVKKRCNYQIPILSIEPIDFGMMYCDNIIKQVLDKLKNEKTV